VTFSIKPIPYDELKATLLFLGYPVRLQRSVGDGDRVWVDTRVADQAEDILRELGFWPHVEGGGTQRIGTVIYTVSGNKIIWPNE